MGKGRKRQREGSEKEEKGCVVGGKRGGAGENRERKRREGEKDEALEGRGRKSSKGEQEERRSERKTTQDAARARSTGWASTRRLRASSRRVGPARGSSAGPGGRAQPRPHRSRTRERFLGGIRLPAGRPSVSYFFSPFHRGPYNLLVSYHPRIMPHVLSSSFTATLTTCLYRSPLSPLCLSIETAERERQARKAPPAWGTSGITSF